MQITPQPFEHLLTLNVHSFMGNVYLRLHVCHFNMINYYHSYCLRREVNQAHYSLYDTRTDLEGIPLSNTKQEISDMLVLADKA